MRGVSEEVMGPEGTGHLKNNDESLLNLCAAKCKRVECHKNATESQVRRRLRLARRLLRGGPLAVARPHERTLPVGLSFLGSALKDTVRQNAHGRAI